MTKKPTPVPATPAAPRPKPPNPYNVLKQRYDQLEAAYNSYRNTAVEEVQTLTAAQTSLRQRLELALSLIHRANELVDAADSILSQIENSFFGRWGITANVLARVRRALSVYLEWRETILSVAEGAALRDQLRAKVIDNPGSISGLHAVAQTTPVVPPTR